MNFSIDSNILVALVNPKDRLNDKSSTLMETRRDNQLILCTSVLKESQTIFRNKINQIIVEIIQFLPNFQDKKVNQMEYQEQLILAFKKIKTSNPGTSNFLDLVYNEIIVFLENNDSLKLPSFLSQLAIRYAQTLYIKIEKMHPNGNVIHLNHDNLEIIKKATSETYFKDPNDERIFYELMTNLPDIKPVEFLTGDKEFAKKIDESYPNCIEYFGYGENSFFCTLVKG